MGGPGARTSNRGGHPNESWLSYAIPLSIAVIAVLGAVVGYRAEAHASLAGAADGDASASSIAQLRSYSDAVVAAQQAQSGHERFVQLGATGTPGTSEAVLPSCTALSFDAADAAGLQLLVNCELQRVFAGYNQPSYWKAANPAAFDSRRYVADTIALDNLGHDVNVAMHTGVASQQRSGEWRMLWLGIALALALALCTMAQVASHHRWHRRLPILLAVPGWIVLGTSTLMFFVWEL